MIRFQQGIAKPAITKEPHWSMARRCFPGVPGTSCTAPTELSFARLPPFFKWPPLRSSRRQWQLISRGFGKTSAAINCTPCPPCQSPPCHKTKCGICVLQLGHFFFLFNSTAGLPTRKTVTNFSITKNDIRDACTTVDIFIRFHLFVSTFIHASNFIHFGKHSKKMYFFGFRAKF